MKKKCIAALLSLVACGSEGEEVSGKYICVGESYTTRRLANLARKAGSS